MSRKKSRLIPYLLIFFLITATAVVALVKLFPLEKLVRDQLATVIKDGVTFSNLSVSWRLISIDHVAVKLPDKSDFVTMKQLRIRPGFSGLLQRKLEIKAVELESPVIAIRRDRKGNLALPVIQTGSGSPGKNPPGESPVDLLLKKVSIANGTVHVKDEQKGFRISLTELAVDLKSSDSILKPGESRLVLNTRVQNGGAVALKAKGDFLDKTCGGTLSVRSLDLALFRAFMPPDMRVKQGVADLDSNFTMRQGELNAPAHLKLKNLELEPGQAFLGFASGSIAGLLKKQGEIDLDFRIYGPYHKPQFDLKDAFAKKFGNLLTQYLPPQVDGTMKKLRNLLPFR